jgi:hypothetical protein
MVGFGGLAQWVRYTYVPVSVYASRAGTLAARFRRP